MKYRIIEKQQIKFEELNTTFFIQRKIFNKWYQCYNFGRSVDCFFIIFVGVFVFLLLSLAIIAISPNFYRLYYPYVFFMVIFLDFLLSLSKIKFKYYFCAEKYIKNKEFITQTNIIVHDISTLKERRKEKLEQINGR